jgi:hypothetical protein
MKKRRSWKFTTGGGALFLVFLFVPVFLGLFSILARGAFEDWLTSGLFLGAFAFLATVLWFVAMRPLVADRLWRLPRSWYEASFALTAVFLFYGIFILVTGYLPSKYGSYPVSREAGFMWLSRASIPLLIGVVAYAYEKWKQA